MHSRLVYMHRHKPRKNSPPSRLHACLVCTQQLDWYCLVVLPCSILSLTNNLILSGFNIFLIERTVKISTFATDVQNNWTDMIPMISSNIHCCRWCSRASPRRSRRRRRDRGPPTCLCQRRQQEDEGNRRRVIQCGGEELPKERIPPSTSTNIRRKR